MAKVTNWLAEQWAKSNLISGLLALCVWGAIIYLSIIGRDPPDVLVGAGGVVMGYFFHTKKD